MRIQEIRDGVMRLIRLPLRTRAQIDADADAELESFLAERIDHLTARGMSANEARQEALRRLGVPLNEATQLLHHSARTRERRMNMRELLDDFSQDLRYTFRTLNRDRQFALFAAIIIALGIGACVTVFSIANAVLLRPLPFRNPEQLVWIENQDGEGLSGQTMQVQNLVDLRSSTQTFTEVAAYSAFYSPNNTRVRDEQETVRLTRVPVTQNFFPTLGIRPMLGRNFSDEESAGQGPRAVILSYGLWLRRYKGDSGIIGKSINMNDAPATVVGVLPRTFDFPAVFAPGSNADMFAPFPLNENTNRQGNLLLLIGRLKPTATLQSIQAELPVIKNRLYASNPKRNKFDPLASSLREHVSGSVRNAMFVLSASVLVVMLIVCANLSNLLLARSTTRQKEMAVRVALGAGRQRLVRQALTESLVLSMVGATIGLALAYGATRSIATMNAVNLPLLSSVQMDFSVIMFAVALAVVAGLAFGVTPALQVPVHAVHSTLKDSGRNSTIGGRGRHVRSSLVVAEVALASMLLVVAGLLSRSFLNVLNVDLGFKPEMVSSIRVDPTNEQRSTQEKFISYANTLLERARALPGVQSAALADGLPLAGNRSWGVNAPGSEFTPGPWPEAFIHVVSDGFMQTLGVKLIEGRDFDLRDEMKLDSVVIINESTAKKFWPGQSALGKILKSDYERQVIGVVSDVRILAPERPTGMEVYLPIRQTGDFSSIQLVVRSSIEPSMVARSLRETLRDVAPNLATNHFDTMQQLVETAVSPRRFLTYLLASFAVFALFLALFGIYGVISYTVNHRTQEIGVRMALGATASQLQMRIIRETLTLAAVGMAIGTVASWILARTLSNMLFGVSAADPVTFAVMLLLLTVVATVSGYLPARRASKIDPMMALRGS